MSNKVYCKDCKFYESEIIDCSEYRYCSAGGVTQRNQYNGKAQKRVLVSLQDNNNGECEHYEPKLWKRLKSLLGG